MKAETSKNLGVLCMFLAGGLALGSGSYYQDKVMFMVGFFVWLILFIWGFIEFFKLIKRGRFNGKDRKI